MSVYEIIALDPVSVARYMDNQFKAILKCIYSDDNLLGEKCLHHFRRRAPMLGASSEEEIAQFIMRVASCALPDKNASPTLYDRVTRFQRHKHNSYCMRDKKTERVRKQNILERALTNESLTKKLWSFAMRTLYNRESGVIEAADVCLMNSLYGTDNDTVLMWLNVFMIRNKRFLPINQIQKLQKG
ncbi:hypothetical protein AGLY_003334 [Aphis glycines]|uniref:Uncharacterized protein n=1 Tax=Aphis glycines TaxID=307491 RepID=A0A6G0U0L2_APHGL|nr:hypothetical protein AGLY_003334 [Aphis glycines]